MASIQSPQFLDPNIIFWAEALTLPLDLCVASTNVARWNSALAVLYFRLAADSIHLPKFRLYDWLSKSFSYQTVNSIHPLNLATHPEQHPSLNQSHNLYSGIPWLGKQISHSCIFYCYCKLWVPTSAPSATFSWSLPVLQPTSLVMIPNLITLQVSSLTPTSFTPIEHMYYLLANQIHLEQRNTTFSYKSFLCYFLSLLEQEMNCSMDYSRPILPNLTFYKDANALYLCCPYGGH